MDHPLVRLLLELSAYGFTGWAAFLLGAYLLPRRKGWSGVFLAHFLIGFAVFYSDAAWVRAKMDKPRWSQSGTPDLDGVFFFACIGRIMAINLLVTPVAIIAVHRRNRARVALQSVRTGSAG